MAIIKLKAGETVIVAAVDPDLEIGGGPMPGGGAPVDPATESILDSVRLILVNAIGRIDRSWRRPQAGWS